MVARHLLRWLYQSQSSLKSITQTYQRLPCPAIVNQPSGPLLTVCNSFFRRERACICMRNWTNRRLYDGLRWFLPPLNILRWFALKAPSWVWSWRALGTLVFGIEVWHCSSLSRFRERGTRSRAALPGLLLTEITKCPELNAFRLPLEGSRTQSIHQLTAPLIVHTLWASHGSARAWRCCGGVRPVNGLVVVE